MQGDDQAVTGSSHKVRSPPRCSKTGTSSLSQCVKVMPTDYKRVLAEMKQKEAGNRIAVPRSPPDVRRVDSGSYNSTPRIRQN